MFENLIAQPATGLLSDDILASRLPQSMLFSGPQSSGKLTAALELARVLSCANGDAVWTCACQSCARHKELINPDLLVLGPRDCILEIRAAARAFLENRGTASRYLFIRSIRKLTCRFNTCFMDQEDSRVAKASPLLADIEERLEEIDPSRPLTEDLTALGKSVNAIVDLAERLEDDFLYDSIPVALVRSASSWARLSPSGKMKTVIIENADRMQDAARNAFLKILEEPPSNVVFILTTSRRGAIMPTILSRVRTYAFVDRPMERQQEVISRVFHSVPEGKELLEGFFNRFLPVPAASIESAATMYLNGILADGIDVGKKPLQSLRSALGQNAQTCEIQQISAMLNKFTPEIVYRLFLARCARVLRESLRTGLADAREISVFAKWSKLIQAACDSVEVYNLTPVASLERLAQEMKESL